MQEQPRESELYEMGRSDAAAGKPKRDDSIGHTSYYVKGYEATKPCRCGHAPYQHNHNGTDACWVDGCDCTGHTPTVGLAVGQVWRSGDDGYLYKIVSVETTNEWVYARHPNSKPPGGLYQILRAWFEQPGWELVRDVA